MIFNLGKYAMLPLLRAIQLLLLVTVAGAEEPREDSLAKSIPPTQLPYLYDKLHNRLGLGDLRIEVGDKIGLRLVCWNEKFDCFSFDFVETKESSFDCRWKMLSPKTGEVIFEGSRRVKPVESSKLGSAISGNSLGLLPAATRPVTVGRPYIFILEVVKESSYNIYYRDSVEVDSDRRNIVVMLALIREIISYCDLKETDLAPLNIASEE